MTRRTKTMFLGPVVEDKERGKFAFLLLQGTNPSIRLDYDSRMEAWKARTDLLHASVYAHRVPSVKLLHAIELALAEQSTPKE